MKNVLLVLNLYTVVTRKVSLVIISRFDEIIMDIMRYNNYCIKMFSKKKKKIMYFYGFRFIIHT
jgi:hypothetical protein